MTMRTLTYQVSFNTPAFLGNAEQQAQWRTPPFKALLRQWWRVTYAANNNFRVDVAAMRDAEGRLFGHAWLENDRDARGDKVAARKSLVRIRLGQWSAGKLKSWDGNDPTVQHDNVPKPVGSQLYMGYGPLVFRNGTALKANAAVQSGEHTTFALACPDEHAALIEQALVLIDHFGTVGGRNRNGWGSFSLKPQTGVAAPVVAVPMRDWKECLGFDWPHAIGKDNQGALIWQTQPHADWKALMKELAMLKISLRTKQFELRLDASAGDRQLYNKNREEIGIEHGAPQQRHWLSYPITHHSVKPWGGNARLPNSLRFKARPTTDGKLIGVIFHMPCLPPPAFNPDRAAIERVWQQVHSFLDGHPALKRSKG